MQPVLPETNGLISQALDLLWRQPPGPAAHRLEHNAASLAGPQRPGRPQPVTAAFHRDTLVSQCGARRPDRVQSQFQAGYRRIHIPGRAAERLTSIGTTRQPGREPRRAKVPGWEDVTLPKRQPRGGYQEPDLPLRYIPAPF